MIKYCKYDISTKVAYVEEYLEILKDNPKYKISHFAQEKGLADSTFNDWLIKYQKDKDKFIHGKNTDGVVDLVKTVKPTFIEISKDRLSNPIENKALFSTIKLNYKDVSIEFDSNQLDKVMEILRRW